LLPNHAPEAADRSFGGCRLVQIDALGSLLAGADVGLKVGVVWLRLRLQCGQALEQGLPFPISFLGELFPRRTIFGLLSARSSALWRARAISSAISSGRSAPDLGAWSRSMMAQIRMPSIGMDYG